MSRKSGFSMVEVLLAMAVGGLVLMAASSLLVTISQAWANRPATRDAFDAHVNGVAHFLSAVLEEATVPSLSKKGDQSVDLQRPVGFSESDAPLIHFYLREAPPLFVWPKGVATRVHAYFHFDDRDGLSFLWFSELQELEKNDEGRMEPEDEEDLRKTAISPFVREIEYCYYGDEDDGPEDIKEWEIMEDLEEDVQSGKYRIPAFVRLTFRWEEEDLERIISLPIEKHTPSGLEEEPQ
ncbi:MAG: prepilin-type N-terminal cleavage/methylation domain-containing protein [Verrucomicrobiota bacterium]|mgnify:CR=1 FL=1|nr:prepilin-type N-terminal cleavage/methylation domain-containing protein [Verrucomicrobiota bacterium]